MPELLLSNKLFIRNVLIMVNDEKRLHEVMGRLDKTFTSKLNEGDDWIQKAVDPAHKGDCTPMTKDTCTPRRKALAKRFKAGIEDESVMEAFVGDDPQEYMDMANKIKQTIDTLFNDQHYDVLDTLYRLLVDRKRPVVAEGWRDEDDNGDDPDAGHTVNGKELSPEEYRKWKEEEGEYDDMDKLNRPRY